MSLLVTLRSLFEGASGSTDITGTGAGTAQQCTASGAGTVTQPAVVIPPPQPSSNVGGAAGGRSSELRGRTRERIHQIAPAQWRLGTVTMRATATAAHLVEARAASTIFIVPMMHGVGGVVIEDEDVLIGLMEAYDG